MAIFQSGRFQTSFMAKSFMQRKILAPLAIKQENQSCSGRAWEWESSFSADQSIFMPRLTELLETHLENQDHSFHSKRTETRWQGMTYPRSLSKDKAESELKQCLPFPGSSDGKESACNAGDPGSTPGWERSPRSKWQSTPVSLPRESHGQTMGSQRVRHD